MCCSGSGTMRRRRAVLTFRGWKSPAWSSPAMRRRLPGPASGAALAAARCRPAGGLRGGGGRRAVVGWGEAGALVEAGIGVGDRVCALLAGGGYAQWCVAPVVQCLPVPEGLSDVQAASLPETFF